MIQACVPSTNSEPRLGLGVNDLPVVASEIPTTIIITGTESSLMQ